MHRSPSLDKVVAWTAVASLGIVGFAAGYSGLIWPYYVAFVAALVTFQLLYFRKSLPQVRVTRGWLVPAMVYALILIGGLILWSFDAPWYAWLIYAAAAGVTRLQACSLESPPTM